MKLSEVLNSVEGLNKRFVYYLEAQGVIAPAKLPKQRIARREYSEADRARIAAMWRYYQRGFSLSRAAALLEEPNRVRACVLLTLPARQGRIVLDALCAYDFVESAAAVYGDLADLLVGVAAPDESDLYELLVGAFAQTHLSVAPTILRLDPQYPRYRQPQASEGEPPRMQAYVLLKVPAKHAGGVLELLQTFPGVLEAAVVYGETDIIAKVAVAGPEALDELVITELQGIPAVESTRTFIVVGSMAWERPAPVPAAAEPSPGAAAPRGGT